MVDEIQRQRQTPRTSNAMDNYYGFGRGLDVRNPGDLAIQRAQSYPSNRQPLLNQPPVRGLPSLPHPNPRMREIMGGLRSLQQMANTNDPESNWRILQQMSPAQQEEYQTADASGIFDMYNEYKDKFGEYDFGDKEYSYDYEKEIGPGTLGIGGKYDFDDEEGKIGATYSMTFDDGGIATLPEFDIPDYMTKDHYMQQVVPKEKVPMTDDQKDYLYDYMLDFMFKQKQREQREMKGRILPFNYEGLEV